MVEKTPDVDTADMDERLAQSQHLIDEAKETAAELAETNPDPYETDREDDAPSGFESEEDAPGNEPPGAVRAHP
jgi:hypothetical protein